MKSHLHLLFFLAFFTLFTSVPAQTPGDGKYDLQFISGAVSTQPDFDNRTAFEYREDEVVNGHFYRLIQFEEIPTNRKREMLEEKGIILLQFIPNYAFMAAIQTDVNVTETEARHFEIRTILEIDTRYKLEPGLYENFVPDWAKKIKGKADLIINFFKDIPGSQVSEQMLRAGLGIELLSEDDPVYMKTIRIPVGNMKKLAALPFISYVEPVEPPAVTENITGTSLHRSNIINSFIPGGKRYDGTGVVISVGDGGLIQPHADLTGRLTNGSNSGSSHATHVAGIIAGAGNIDPIARGQAPGAEIISFTSHNDISNSSTINTLYTNAGVRVTNHSLGQTCNAGYNSNARLLDLHVENFPSLFNVFSAGNSGGTNCGYGAGTSFGNITGGYKAAKNAITLGNLSRIDVIANSSSRGPSADGRIKPDITAKGSSVYSTELNNTYSSKTGTSMSAPGVAGCIAQLIHAYRDLNNGNDPTLALLKGIILNTADDLGNPGPDYVYGWGRINVARAYNVIESSSYFSDTMSQGGNNTHNITVPAGTKEVRVMVYWADPAAASGVSVALVNDLDITLTAPNNTVYEPWLLSFQPNATLLNQAAVRGIDRRNNMEQVTLVDPVAGTYTLNVQGFAVPQGPQEYFVIYEFVKDEITVMYPLGGESFVPGEAEFIRWDAFGDSGNFQIEYSINNGISWNNISSNVSGSRRYYTWLVPNFVTGEAMIRVSRGSLSGESESTFSIIPVPQNLQVDWRCLDSLQLSWDPMTEATKYQVYVLGNKYMDSAGVTTDTFATILADASTIRWASVKALADNGQIIGRRAFAVEVGTAMSGCSNAPPVSDFIASETNTCTGIVNFTDNSSNNPNVWFWDFGDGNTSTKENPSHRYSVQGSYSVSLTTTNSTGSHQTLKAAYITYDDIQTPVTVGDTICAPGTAELKASGTGDLVWYNSQTGGFPLFTGPVYSTNITETSTFFVEATQFVTTPGIQYVGQPNNFSGSGGYYTAGDNHGLIFDVHTPMTIKTVKVYSNEATARMIEVLDEVNGNVVQSKFVYIPTGEHRLALDFDLLPGQNYLIKISGTVNLFRNNSGTSYPYSINNLVTIKHSTVTSNPLGFYYYFYDWEVEEIGCQSSRIPVTAAIEVCPGIDDLSILSGFSVFPNPTAGQFEVNFTVSEYREVTIEVINLLGQKVYFDEVEANGSFKKQIDISKLPAGVYLVQVKAGDEIVNRRVVKE